MIDTVVSVKLPIGEMLRIKRNRLMPDVVTGEEKRICLVSGIYGDELGGQYICGEIIRRIKAEFENLTDSLLLSSHHIRHQTISFDP